VCWRWVAGPVGVVTVARKAQKKSFFCSPNLHNSKFLPYNRGTLQQNEKAKNDNFPKNSSYPGHLCGHSRKP
jgi:hypothetical protein